jgi:predicted acetyltransferase
MRHDMAMSLDLRQLAADDALAAWELGRLAFGSAREKPEGWRLPDPHRTRWGAFDGAGRLVAMAADRHQRHWFGGRLVPASGVASVAVTPELSGRSLARQVLTRLLAEARDRGAVISTLFDTTPVPYRRLGWEEVGALTWRTMATAALGRLRPPADIDLRPATAADVLAIHALYEAVARAGNGMMDRTGPTFDPSPQVLLDSFDGVTMAIGGDGGPIGYLTWDRGRGYDADSRLTVHDLIGATPAATTALMGMLASWTSVAPTLELRLPEPDPFFLLAPSATQPKSRQPWMLRLVDAPAAVAARGWPPLLDASVDLRLDDDVCPWNSGTHRLVLSGGTGRLEPGGAGSVGLSMRGFALLYAGAAAPAMLRRSGLIDGGDAATDAVLLAAASGPAPALLDYF